MLADLFLAVAQSVISYALEEFDPADRLREWLKRDAATLAYQKALARAYSAFARQYPELTASLFDQSFLTNEASPELAKLLIRGPRPDPAILAQLWAKSVARSVDDGMAVRAASDFLGWLEAELSAESVFQPLFDSRALDSIESRLDQLVRELQSKHEAALAAAHEYEQIITNVGGVQIGSGSQVSAGGHIVGRDLTIYNNYYSGGFTSLKDYYDPPDSIFERVRVDDFVGRDWLVKKVDEFLSDSKRTSGALVIIGDAGVGKTSFAAHLVKTRGYPHLFADQLGGQEKLPAAIRSLSVQLISRYRIRPYADRDSLPTEPSQFDRFLDKILRYAVKACASGEKIVILCDALDEAGIAPGGNVFGLPDQLPEGVYFILTRRPAPAVKLDMRPLPEPVELRAVSDENLSDVREYLTAKAHSPAIADQLAAGRYSPDQFVNTLTDKSEGLWIYLQYVLQEIASSDRAPLDLAKLPAGLTAYYAEYWGDWRNGRNRRGEGRVKWNKVYAPLLCTLAAAQEPLPVVQLAQWASVDLSEAEELLAERWRAFLREGQTPSGEYVYSLYHASLRDFLTGSSERSGVLPEHEWIARDLVRGTTDAHRRIVEHYRAQCSGNWPALASDDYARRYLALHLSGAERFDELFKLVVESNEWAEARYAKEESYAGYLLDLDRAWKWAESDVAWSIGRQIRCALIQSSIFSSAGNISPELLAQLVEAKLWSPARALAHVEQMPDEIQRAKALTRLAALMDDALKAEALAAARAIRGVNARVIALLGLAPHLPNELKADVFEMARAIDDEYVRVDVLSELAIHLPERLKDKAWAESLAAARAIKDEGDRSETLIVIGRQWPHELNSGLVQTVREIEDEAIRSEALSKLITYLPRELVTEILSVTEEIKDDYHRAQVLIELAARLPVELKGHALRLARGILDEYWRSVALERLMAVANDEFQEDIFEDEWETDDTSWNIEELGVPALPVLDADEQLNIEAVRESLRMVWDIVEEKERLEVLSDLMASLHGDLVPYALQVTRELNDRRLQAETLIVLAMRLPEKLRSEALADAVRTMWVISDEEARAFALTSLAVWLSKSLGREVVHEAVSTIRAIEDGDARASASKSCAELGILLKVFDLMLIACVRPT